MESRPTAVALLLAAFAFWPTARLPWAEVAFASSPIAIPLIEEAVAFGPTATEFEPVAPVAALALLPVLVEFTWKYSELLSPIFVDNAYSCAPFTASVEVADTSPAATFLIWRLTESLPTETTPLPSVCLTDAL